MLNLFISTALFFLSSVGPSKSSKTEANKIEKNVSFSNSVSAKTNFNPFFVNITSKVKLSKVKQEDPIIGYWWILFNDGCYYLGRVTETPDGEYWWEPLTIFDYIGKTVDCSLQQNFENFC
jgi:hypothetical protein